MMRYELYLAAEGREDRGVLYGSQLVGASDVQEGALRIIVLGLHVLLKHSRRSYQD